MNKNSIVFSNFARKKEKKERNLYNNIIRKFELHHRILQNRYDATPSYIFHYDATP